MPAQIETRQNDNNNVDDRIQEMMDRARASLSQFLILQGLLESPVSEERADNVDSQIRILGITVRNYYDIFCWSDNELTETGLDPADVDYEDRNEEWENIREQKWISLFGESNTGKCEHCDRQIWRSIDIFREQNPDSHHMSIVYECTRKFQNPNSIIAAIRRGGTDVGGYFDRLSNLECCCRTCSRIANITTPYELRWFNLLELMLGELSHYGYYHGTWDLEDLEELPTL